MVPNRIGVGREVVGNESIIDMDGRIHSREGWEHYGEGRHGENKRR